MNTIANTAQFQRTRLLGIAILGFGVMVFFRCPLNAQDFSKFATNMPRMKAVFSTFCPETPEFSARANIGVFNQGKLQMSYMQDFAVTADRMCQDIDVMSMAQIPAEQRAAMKQAHLDKVVIITRIDTKTVYVVFPRLRAYSSFPIPDDVLDEISTRKEALKIQKTDLGTETVNGRFCTKTLVTVSETNHPTEQAVVWSAANLQPIPCKIEISAGGQVTQFHFGKVEAGTPNAAAFEVITNYVRFSNVNAITRYAIDKLQKGTNLPLK
jgi:hypothetical protein